jgi:polar amino acid transport system substrate-binding protein
LIAALWSVASAIVHVRAQTPDTSPTIAPLPFLWHLPDDFEPPDLSKLKGINFLTDSDYPPFNYRDERGNLVGFNVDLAKAMCSALRLRCRISARKWGDLIPAIEQQQADAAIASIAISAENREKVDFSFPYYRSPARFMVQKQSRIEKPTPQSLEGKPVGVRAGTAHEAYLKAFFGGADIRTYDTATQVREALRTGEVDALFGDGTSFMFWINGTASRGCCRFLPGAFIESRYFGNGAGIAVKKGNTVIRDAINYALDRIKVSGAYDRIYRKHFPLDLY